MAKVFIDGSSGTAGLRIHSRLAGRADIELTVLDGAERRDVKKRRDALNSCDIAVLCLPDDASRESVSMIENPDVRVVAPPRPTESPPAGRTASPSSPRRTARQ